MTHSILHLASRLLKNGLHFQYLKWTGKPGSPQAVSLEITHNCIARCIMCDIWKIPREVPDLPIDAWICLLSSDLLSDLRELDVTGGEPFVRKDLVDLFKGICELKEGNLKALKSVAVTTNGFLTSRVLEYTEKILLRLRDKHIDLVMVCAMDAIGEIHERIRNYKDAWFKVNETIEGLKRLREKFPNLIIGLKTTVLPVNVAELDNIAQYADANGLFTIISPRIITKARYLNYDHADDLAFTRDDMARMIRFYKSDRFRWSFHGERLVHYLSTGMMRKPCSCGFNYFFVRSTGEVYLCPLIDVGLGSIHESSIKDLFHSERASRMRQNIGRYPECRQCTEPGLERYALPYAGFTYLSLLLTMGRKKFFQLHHHLGLDKYLD
jgi:MoaA/NifB/PqqE/SkfB family radical SAM enzyme